MWNARHNIYYATLTLRTSPKQSVFSTDVCVPISKLADCVLAAQIDAKNKDLLITILGHVGDGNFHCTPIFDPNNLEEVKKVDEFNHNLVINAIAMGGTCTESTALARGRKNS